MPTARSIARSVGGNSCSGRGFASCHVTTCNEIVAELRQAGRPLGAESNGVRCRVGVGVRVQKAAAERSI